MPTAARAIPGQPLDSRQSDGGGRQLAGVPVGNCPTPHECRLPHSLPSADTDQVTDSCGHCPGPDLVPSGLAGAGLAGRLARRAWRHLARCTCWAAWPGSRRPGLTASYLLWSARISRIVTRARRGVRSRGPGSGWASSRESAGDPRPCLAGPGVRFQTCAPSPAIPGVRERVARSERPRWHARTPSGAGESLAARGMTAQPGGHCGRCGWRAPELQRSDRKITQRK
jgi:hypothetical protein